MVHIDGGSSGSCIGGRRWISSTQRLKHDRVRRDHGEGPSGVANAHARPQLDGARVRRRMRLHTARSDARGGVPSSDSPGSAEIGSPTDGVWIRPTTATSSATAQKVSVGTLLESSAEDPVITVRVSAHHNAVDVVIGLGPDPTIARTILDSCGPVDPPMQRTSCTALPLNSPYIRRTWRKGKALNRPPLRTPPTRSSG